MARSQTETVSAQGGMDLLTRPDPLPTVGGPPEPEDPEEVEESSSRRMHPDVRLLSSLIRQLMEVTPAARRRVMGFLVDLVNEGEQQ